MTQVWGHRGSRREAPENTMPSFRRALELGVDGIELDVQLTADGEMVVIHDETVERTTNGHGHVGRFSLSQLQRLDASAGIQGFADTRIPTLEEVLELLAPSGVAVNIELKNSVEPYPGLEEKVLAAVEAHGLADRVILSSFNHYSLRHLIDLGAPSPLGMIYSDPLYRPWRYADDLGVQAIHPPARYVMGQRMVAKAHKHGLEVRPWVVNNERRLTQMFRWGVDGVFTDVPGLAIQLRDSEQ